MNRAIRGLTAVVLGTVALTSLVLGLPVQTAIGAADSVPLELVTTLEVGGIPEAIVVDCCDGRNDVVFWDLSTAKVRFIDGNTLQVAPEEIYLPSWSFDGWIAYNRYHNLAYVLQVNLRYSPNWQEVIARVVWSRTITNSFSINGSYNPPASVVDSNYVIDGFVFKQPLLEGNDPGRLIIDNTYMGNIDVVDLGSEGTGAVQWHRYSYRDPTSPPYHTNAGNSLALEPRHETLSSDDLANSDMLYIADHNEPTLGPPDGYGFIKVLTLTHPLTDLIAVRQPDIDLNDTWPFWQGAQGLAMAGPRDTLYVASAIQSFNAGYLAAVDTTDNDSRQVVDLTYADPGFALIDWYDPRMAFVTTFDGFYNDPTQGLYLHLLYDEAVVYTLRLMDDFDEYSGPHGIAFDPYHRLLYLTLDNEIMVVRVNYGLAPPAPTASGLIRPEGGSVRLPDGSARVTCPAGAVGQPTLLTLTEADPTPTGDLVPVRFFDISAVISGTTTPVTSTNQPCQIRVEYTEPDRIPATESTLAVHQRDGTGDQWSQSGITSTVNGIANVATAQITRFRSSALLGETNRVYLPLMMRTY